MEDTPTKRWRRRKKKTEAIFQAQASALLQYDGWRYFKMEPVSRREWGKGFGERGMPDALYLRYTPEVQPATADVLWIEFKSPRGRAMPHQLAWHEAERARGAVVVCAGIDFPANIPDFLKWYQHSGLQRREAL